MLLLLLRSKVFEPGEFSHESLLKLFQKALEWLSLTGWGFSLYLLLPARWPERGVYSHVPRQIMTFCISIEKNFESLVLNQVALQKPADVSHVVPSALPLDD
jgi:hypothetical protein